MDAKLLAEQASQEYAKGEFAAAAGLFSQAAQAYSHARDDLNAAEMKNNQSVALLKAGQAKDALQVTDGTAVIFHKPLAAWGHVLHDPDLAEAILDRVLERGRHIQLRGPSYRTRHHQKKEKISPDTDEALGARISGNLVPEFPEPTLAIVEGISGVTNSGLSRAGWIYNRRGRAFPQRCAHVPGDSLA